MKNVTYSTAQIEEMLGVSKSSLRRWEKDKALSWNFPPVERNLKTGDRVYEDRHVWAIIQHVLSHEFEIAANHGNLEAMDGISERLSLFKLRLNINETGLQELRERPFLRSETIKALVEIALERYEPHDKKFAEIFYLAAEQSRNLVEKNKSIHPPSGMGLN